MTDEKTKAAPLSEPWQVSKPQTAPRVASGNEATNDGWPGAPRATPEPWFSAAGRNLARIPGEGWIAAALGAAALGAALGAAGAPRKRWAAIVQGALPALLLTTIFTRLARLERDQEQGSSFTMH